MPEKLSDQGVETLPRPPSGERVTYDEDVSGFGVRLQSTGAPVFVFDYQPAARPRRIVIGGFPTWSTAAARDKARRLSRLTERGYLTDALVKELPAPPQGHEILYDDQVSGFGVRITAAGGRSFVLNYRAGSRERRMTLGSFPVWSVPAAREEAKRLKRLVDQGQDPMGERHELRAGATIAQLAERYLEEYAEVRKKPRSAAEDRRNINLHVKPQLGRIKLSELSFSDVSRFHAAMKDRPTGGNRCLALLSHMWTMAEAWGMVEEGAKPFAIVRGERTRRRNAIRLYAERKAERFLSEAELATLGEAITAAEREGTAPYVAAALRALILTGCRKSEILGLRWSEVDLERAQLRLEDSKTGAKVVQLNAPAVKLLAELPRVEGHPFVFPGERPGEPLHNIDASWRVIRKAAKLPDVRLHDLRHSFASVAIGLGAPLAMIGKLLGHATPATTQRYAHLADDALKRTTDLVGARLAAAMGGAVAPSADVVALPARGRRKRRDG